MVGYTYSRTTVTRVEVDCDGDQRQTEGHKGRKIGGARARGSKNMSPVLNSLYLVDIKASFTPDEQLEVLVSLVAVLPGQPSEHDLLEKIIDPLHALSGDAWLVSGDEFVPPHIRLANRELLPSVQLRPLFVCNLGLHRLVDRMQDVTQRDGR